MPNGVDIATLGVRVTQDGVAQATAGLNGLAGAGDKAAASVADFARAGASAAQITQLTGASAATARDAVGRYGAQAAETAAEIQGLALAEEEMAAAGVEAAAATGLHGLQLGRLNAEAGTTAARLLGVNTALGRQTALIGGAVGGYGEMIGVLGAVTAGLEVYEAWTEDARNARDAQNELTDSLTKWYEKRAEGPAGDLPKQIEAMTEKLKTLHHEMDSLMDGKFFTATQAVGQGGSKLSAWIRILTAGDFTAIAQQFGLEVAKGTSTVAKQIDEGGKAIAAAHAEAAKKVATAAKEAADAADRAEHDLLRTMEGGWQDIANSADDVTKAFKPVLTALDKALSDLEASYKRYVTADQRFSDAIRDQLNQGLYGGIKAATIPPPDPAIAKEQEYVRQMQDIWSRGIEKIVTDGTKSFHDFFDDVLQLFSKLMEKMQAAGKDSGVGYQLLGLGSAAVTGGVAGYQIGQQSGSSVTGFLGGGASGAIAGAEIAGPWGAVIGGLVGAAGGLLGAADAQHKAAEAIQQAAAQLLPKLAAYDNPNSTVSSLAQNQATFETLLNELNTVVSGGHYDAVGGLKAYQKQLNDLYAAKAAADKKITDDFWSGITQAINATQGAAGNYQNQLLALKAGYDSNVASATALNATTAQLATITDLYTTQVAQLKAAYQESIDQINLSLDAREAAAKGDNDAAAAITRRAAEEKELFDDEQAGYTADQLARVKYIQGLEDQVAAQAKAAAEVERYTQSMAGLTATFLQLTGQSDAAAQAQLAEQQRQATNALVNANASPAELALNNVVQLFQRGQLAAQQEIAAQTATLNASLKVEQDQLSVAQSSLQALQQAAASLKTFDQSLTTGSLSPLSPIDQLNAAKAARDSLYQAAVGGDATAANNYGSAAQNYLQLAQGYYASGPGYQSAYASTKGQADQLSAQYEHQASLQQQTVDALNAQITLLQNQLATLQNANTLTQATRDAVIAELEKDRDAALVPNGQMIDQLNALRDTLTGVGRDIVTSERDILVGDQNNLTAATAAEVAAINAGASAAQIAALDQIRTLESQKTAYDDAAAQQIAALASSLGWDSPVVQNLIDQQTQYDKGVNAQISAIRSVGGDVASSLNPVLGAIIAAGGFLGTEPAGPSHPIPTGLTLAGTDTSAGSGALDAYNSFQLFDPYTGDQTRLANGTSSYTDTLGYRWTPNGWAPPGFASGGDFSGGLRLVGERGPELEATGPSRITNTNALLSAMSNPELLAELKALRSDIRSLYGLNQAGAKATVDRLDALIGETQDNTNKTTRGFERLAKVAG